MESGASTLLKRSWTAGTSAHNPSTCEFITLALPGQQEPHSQPKRHAVDHAIYTHLAGRPWDTPWEMPRLARTLRGRLPRGEQSPRGLAPKTEGAGADKRMRVVVFLAVFMSAVFLPTLLLSSSLFPAKV